MKPVSTVMRMHGDLVICARIMAHPYHPTTANIVLGPFE
jgi:hypothetical protein